MKSQLLSLSFLFLFIFFFSSSAQAQSEESKKDSSAVTVTGVAIGDISEESEALGLRLLKLKTTLVQSERIIEIDSIVEASAPEILILIDSNFLKITKKELEGQFESKDISDGFDENIEVLKETMRLAQSRSDKVFITQKKITDLVLIIDEEIANIELAELKRQKDYFVFDNEPIWKSDFSEDEARDSVSVVRNSTNLIVIGLKQNREQFWSFYRLNIKTAIFQFGFLIVFLVLLIVANFKWKKRVLSIKTRLEEEAKIVLAHPILTTLSLGVLISAFFYESMVPAYAELHVLIVLFGSILLLPKLTTQKTIPFLWLVFLVYIINTFEAFIGLKSNLVRWLLIFDAMMLVYALHLGRSLMFENKERFLQIFRVARFVSVLYTILLFFSIFANIIGMVALSNFLSKAILVSMTFGIVTFLCVKVVTSLN